MGEKFFKGIKFKGLGNIEFKRDESDVKLKLIEVNPRFTAAQELLVRSGLDIAFIIYSYLIGQKVSASSIPKETVRLWSPFQDFKAYRELRNAGKISFFQWIKTVAHKQVFPYFSIDDPFPSIVRFIKNDVMKLKKLFLK